MVREPLSKFPVVRFKTGNSEILVRRQPRYTKNLLSCILRSKNKKKNIKKPGPKRKDRYRNFAKTSSIQLAHGYFHPRK